VGRSRFTWASSPHALASRPGSPPVSNRTEWSHYASAWSSRVWPSYGPTNGRAGTASFH
jgi:hypothetical protein